MHESINRNGGLLSRRAGPVSCFPMWALPPRQPVLEQGGLHIWRVSLALPPMESEPTEKVLSTEERDQCARFVRPADRARCRASRASLRVVLAKYVRSDPRALSIRTGASGKPWLDRAGNSIQFNLSHAGDLALIAVARGLRVGIDVERVRDVDDMDEILDGFFSERESAWLRSRDDDERTRAFFLLWTRREAAAKALGTGLFDSFARFTLPPSEQAASGFRVALPDRPPGPARTWWMRDLSPGPGYAGAVCVEQDNPQPMLWKLGGDPHASTAGNARGCDA